ncbi:hypothetical protein LEP1GSC203_0464 [Leptospira terpstrae serovar Hualin str. LT 11-33 = ATCC 700639]|uniref:Uncharacterized protein n=1 Tax=Leptospira terpstrae serovar Hualin str. LT 11-33 = ATCC 700639 TaxID=1257025 RepID=N1VU22_9LEPT|nr:hypothetical protein LEP1GSC203_0464 [Leptospira terpstrae serovar Hualin str. LT 11-33 = ATCC 700639]
MRYIGFYVQYIRFTVFDFLPHLKTDLNLFLSSGATPTEEKQE